MPKTVFVDKNWFAKCFFARQTCFTHSMSQLCQYLAKLLAHSCLFQFFSSSTFIVESRSKNLVPKKYFTIRRTPKNA